MPEAKPLTVNDSFTPAPAERTWRQRFEEAWLREQRPAIEDYLPPDDTDRRAVLLELIRADLELRLRAGEAARVETYLEHYPELANDRQALVNLIVAEYALRRSREPGLPLHGYLMRFTSYAEELTGRLAQVARDLDARAGALVAAGGPAIPGYEILGELGWGGMGIVYKARQLSLNRLVALKVIRTEATDAAVKRFIREAQVAAQLLHSHIVTVYDAGQADHTHFIVMEYVDGIDLAKLVKQEGALSVPQACEYLRQAALGLQHAHERGLVHRDIKPANLIVSPPPDPARARTVTLPFRGAIVKILDMGLARLDDCLEPCDAPVESDSSLTANGAVMGTPDFMAPEQAADAHAADIRADLYSLGCTLYYLLTGRVPFPGGTTAEKREKHRSQEPTPLARLRPEVPTGLVEVVQTLMAKKPEERFATPADVVAVLKPFARGRSADDAETDINGLKPKSSGEIRLPKFIPTLTGAGALSDQVGEYRCFTGHRDWVWSVAFSSDGRRILSGSRDRSLRLWDLKTARELRRFDAHTDDVRSVAFSPDSHHALSGGSDKVLRLWNVASGRELRALEGHTDAILSVAFFPEERHTQSYWDWLMTVTNVSVEFSSEGRLLLSGSRDGTLRLWNMESGEELRRLNGRTEFMSVAFATDGLSALTSSANNTVRLWAVEDGRDICRFDGQADLFWSVALSPEGSRALSGSEDKTVRLWDVESGQELLRFDGHSDWVTSVAFSPDGRRAVSGSDDRTVRLWDVETGRALHVFEGHTDGITCVAFSPDGLLALSGSADGTVRCWRLPRLMVL